MHCSPCSGPSGARASSSPYRSPCTASPSARASSSPYRSPCSGSSGARASSSPYRSPCTASSSARGRSSPYRNAKGHAMPFFMRHSAAGKGLPGLHPCPRNASRLATRGWVMAGGPLFCWPPLLSRHRRHFHHPQHCLLLRHQPLRAKCHAIAVATTTAPCVVIISQAVSSPATFAAVRCTSLRATAALRRNASRCRPCRQVRGQHQHHLHQHLALLRMTAMAVLRLAMAAPTASV
jgi:hypothetical protein